MNKPITVLREEFAQGLVKLCNESGLPFFCIESILKEMIGEVHTASIKQYESDLKRYSEEEASEEEDA